MPRLIELIRAAGLTATLNSQAENLSISGIAADSREIRLGMIFVAIPGGRHDGEAFIADAIGKGAVAIVTSSLRAQRSNSKFLQGLERFGPKGPRSDVCIIEAENPRLALSRLAAAFYPQQPEHMVAVTGTDGKTSTVDFFRQLANKSGHKAASIGTLGTLGEDRKKLAPGLHTTPDPAALHHTLQQLAAQAYTHVAMEASSHGLDQFRLDGVKLQAAAFTNLSRDHLDYHGTEEAYFGAKQRLFADLLPEGSTAVLNADDKSFATLRAIAEKRKLRLLTYGRQGRDFAIIALQPTPQGQHAELRIAGKDYRFELPHVGGFQVYNMLAALGLLVGLGEKGQELAPLMPQLTGVPGRLERVGVHQDAAIYVDYAHTPAALANVLSTLRKHTLGRLLVVFGCGGERDAGKRPQMGKAACELADMVFVTDDNPRGEDPAAIRAAVLAACPAAKEVADRKEAIYAAIKMLQKGDVLLVAGKGHEKTQVIAGVAHPFDDADVLRKAIRP